MSRRSIMRFNPNARGRPTIFVVEDEEVIGLSIRESLVDAGFRVQLFSEAAPVLVAIEHASIAAAVIDVGLPDIAGDELARRCRAHRQSLPIILTTGYDEHRFADLTAADPFLRLLGKPFDIPRLLLLLDGFGIQAEATADDETTVLPR
jgi:DNA-binding NtrC family response regulator